MANAIPATTSQVTAAITNNTAAASSTASSTGVDQKSLAQNFTSFLQLLTTQLRNQNPLDPLDTNQFTQQLVQFAQVEQQLKSNDQLSTLVSLQKTAQSTAALSFVGKTVAVDGTTAKLQGGSAVWSFDVPKPAATSVTITNSVGQTVYTGTFTMNPGAQQFQWDGRGNNGTQWPEGDYTISVAAKDASGQSVAISTEVEGLVDSVDLTKTPPLLAIGGQQFGIEKIKRVVHHSN